MSTDEENGCIFSGKKPLWKKLWTMWKSHAFQHLFSGFEQGGAGQISHFFDKIAEGYGYIMIVTETKKAGKQAAVFAEKVGKIFFRVEVETLRPILEPKNLLKSSKQSRGLILVSLRSCHCEPVTDVTGVAISSHKRSFEIPTPVCALARNDIFLTE